MNLRTRNVFIFRPYPLIASGLTGLFVQLPAVIESMLSGNAPQSWKYSGRYKYTGLLRNVQPRGEEYLITTLDHFLGECRIRHWAECCQPCVLWELQDSVTADRTDGGGFLGV